MYELLFLHVLKFVSKDIAIAEALTKVHRTVHASI